MSKEQHKKASLINLSSEYGISLSSKCTTTIDQ